MSPTIGYARTMLRMAVDYHGLGSPAARAARGRVDAFLGELHSDEACYRVAWKRQTDGDGYSNRSQRRHRRNGRPAIAWAQ